jgi:hypothetical protein
VVELEDVKPGVIFDFDKDGKIVTIKLVDVRNQLSLSALRALQVA